jgi:D-cysteine desulfhydrase
VISRRRFLRNTLLGGALLGTAGIVGRHLSGYHLDDATAHKLRALSPKEYLILDAVVRRMLAADAADAPPPDGAALFVDSYLTRIDEGNRSDVRALLQLVEHGSGPFRFGLTRFTHMTPDEQDATLRDWESSRLALRRQGFQALKSMAMLGYWRLDATWPLIGYTGPMLPQKVPG